MPSGMSDKPRPIRERFPPPWTVEETPSGFVVTSANGVRLAYVYTKPRSAIDGLTVSEARAVATAISRLSINRIVSTT